MSETEGKNNFQSLLNAIRTRPNFLSPPAMTHHCWTCSCRGEEVKLRVEQVRRAIKQGYSVPDRNAILARLDLSPNRFSADLDRLEHNQKLADFLRELESLDAEREMSVCAECATEIRRYAPESVDGGLSIECPARNQSIEIPSLPIVPETESPMQPAPQSNQPLPYLPPSPPVQKKMEHYKHLLQQARECIPSEPIPSSMFPWSKKRLLKTFFSSPLAQVKLLCAGDARAEEYVIHELDGIGAKDQARVLAGIYRYWRAGLFDAYDLGAVASKVIAREHFLRPAIQEYDNWRWVDYLICKFNALGSELLEHILELSRRQRSGSEISDPGNEIVRICQCLLVNDARGRSRCIAASVLSKMKWQGDTPYERAWMLVASKRWEEALRLGIDGLGALLIWGADSGDYNSIGSIMSVLTRTPTETGKQLQEILDDPDYAFIERPGSDLETFRKNVQSEMTRILTGGFQVLRVSICLSAEHVAPKFLSELITACEPIQRFSLGKITPIMSTSLQSFIWQSIEIIDKHLGANGAFSAFMFRNRPSIEIPKSRTTGEWEVFVQQQEGECTARAFPFHDERNQEITFVVCSPTLNSTDAAKVSPSKPTQHKTAIPTQPPSIANVLVEEQYKTAKNVSPSALTQINLDPRWKRVLDSFGQYISISGSESKIPVDDKMYPRIRLHTFFRDYAHADQVLGRIPNEIMTLQPVAEGLSPLSGQVNYYVTHEGNLKGKQIKEYLQIVVEGGGGIWEALL